MKISKLKYVPSKLLLSIPKLGVHLTFKMEGCGSRFIKKEGMGEAFSKFTQFFTPS